MDLEEKRLLDNEVASNASVLEFGLPLRLSSPAKEVQLRTLLKSYGFDPCSCMIAFGGGRFLLDYRIFGLLYDEIIDSIFDQCCNGPIDEKNLVHAKWLKREGDELYFYASSSELIARVLLISLEACERDESDPYVLCPVGPEGIKFVNRVCYSEFLRGAIDLRDEFGYSLEVKDGKQVIHFVKKKLSQALEIYTTIFESNPMECYELSLALCAASKWRNYHA